MAGAFKPVGIDADSFFPPRVESRLAAAFSGSKWRTGAGAPATSLGIVGDWYLNSANGDYHEKTATAVYTLRGNLKGPTGTSTTGAPGSVWRTGSGAPSTSVGVVGDWYLDTASGDYHEKTGAAAYTLRGNLKGPAGTATMTDASTTAKGAVQLAGDLAGIAAAPTVAKVRGVTVSTTAPTTGQVLTATGGTAAAWATPAASGTSAVPRLGRIVVASSQAPQAVKDQAQFVAPGTNDQDVINSACALAARGADITGGTGAGEVACVGGDFFIGNNNTGVVKMYPSVWLHGSGPATLFQPMHSSYTGLGCFELYSTNTDHTRLSDLTIGRLASVVARVHCVKYQGIGVGNAYGIQTGNDPYHRLHDIIALKSSGHGFYIYGTSGGARETQMDQCVSWDSALSGFYLDGSSDCKLTACTAQSGSGGPGFYVGGGNSKVTACKSYFSDGSTDGYQISSSRAEIVGCSAQDNGRYGFNITSADATIDACVADSNGRIDATGGGFLIGSAGTYSALHAFDRAQTPASPQLRGIIFSGTPQVYLTGRVRVPSGTAHVVGAPGANSFMRIVRDGTTLVTAG